MDKNAIKKYAIWARNELRDRISNKMDLFEITTDADPKADSVRGRLLTKEEKSQRAIAIAEVKDKGIDQVVEEVAYTWFNRFSALRFMEVNNYLPTRIRVFTNENNEFKPQILTEAIHMEIDGLDMEKVYNLKEKNNNDELYKYLIITQCNALSSILPGMFQKISDYTELLFPDNLLRKGSVIEQMICIIPENDWNVSGGGQVEILGWLYQYYNTDLFNSIFDGDKSRKSLTSEEIPAATQLFTPDWAVGYMVENSLGKLWMDSNPNSKLSEKWKYFLSNDCEDSDSAIKFDKQFNSEFNPAEIKCIDPCAGSGHILAYLFDVLVDIYRERGFSDKEAVRSIIKHNLWGLDIDERAAQLAYFSIMMKALQYDARFLRRNEILQPNVYAIPESNNIHSDCLKMLGTNYETAHRLVNDFIDAKEFGSILKISLSIEEINHLIDDVNTIISSDRSGMEISDFVNITQLREEFLPLLMVAQTMMQKYEIVVTNPPYLASPRMNAKLADYIKQYYEAGKADFATVMYLAIQENFSKKNGLVSLITTNSWMYIKSFLKMRKLTFSRFSFTSIVDYGTELFEGKIGHLPIVAWVACNSVVQEQFPAIRLVDYKYGRRNEKYEAYFDRKNKYYAKQSSFEDIDGAPVDYWLSEKVLNTFKEKKLESFVEIVSGMTTGNNDKYLREWNEVDISHIAFDKTDISEVDLKITKWIPYHKGGEQRKWYGNHEYIVNWSQSKNFNRAKTTMTHVYLKPCITWSDISGNSFAGRFCYGGFMFDVKGSCAFGNNDDLKLLIGLFNSKVTPVYVEALNPTSTTQVGDLKRIPFILPDESTRNRIYQLVDECVAISKEDWDSYEFSWDFREHPFITAIKKASGAGRITMEQAFEDWQKTSENRFNSLKEKEEELNRIYLTLYGLDDEMSPEVAEKDITVRKADLERDVRSFISYAIGCMFGRYTLGREGLIYAGGDWDCSKYTIFQPDKDAILPICDDEYFEDDIVGLFIKFVESVFGRDTLEENLGFIADALGGKDSSREVIRNYLLNDFYADHLKIYHKRPLYWLFESGKKNGFKCLVYMHRYRSDTIARIRTDYVHEQQSRYQTAITGLERQIADASTSNRVRLNKRIAKLREQAEEIRLYEEKIHHLADQMISIDLDDGVVHNYELFKDVLAKI